MKYHNVYVRDGITWPRALLQEFDYTISLFQHTMFSQPPLLSISHDMFCTRTFAIRIISNTLDYKKYIILREVNQVFWHSKRITGQASYSDLRKNILVTLHKLTYEVDKCNEWLITKMNQVRMSHSGSDTNSLKGRGDRVSVHTHTDTHTTLLNHQQTNQPTCPTVEPGPMEKAIGKTF